MTDNEVAGQEYRAWTQEERRRQLSEFEQLCRELAALVRDPRSEALYRGCAEAAARGLAQGWTHESLKRVGEGLPQEPWWLNPPEKGMLDQDQEAFAEKYRAARRLSIDLRSVATAELG